MVDIDKIELLRHQHGYTQEGLATLMGYAKTTYNCKVRRARQFTVEDIVKLCNIFQLEPNDLIQW